MKILIQINNNNITVNEVIRAVLIINDDIIKQKIVENGEYVREAFRGFSVDFVARREINQKLAEQAAAITKAIDDAASGGNIVSEGGNKKEQKENTQKI